MFLKKFILASILIGLIYVVKVESVTPVVLWHGMGDNCCNPLSMGSIKNMIENELPGVYVLSLELGNNEEEDSMNGFFLNVNKQIDMACDIIRNDTHLSNGFNAIGFSQGGQFLRAVVQRCSDVNMKSLISIGGQHQGVYGFPRCPMNVTALICNTVRELLNYGAYLEFVQDKLVQAQYWHDPLNEKIYRAKSTFLADINQENTFNQQYKSNMIRLENLVLVKFNHDTMVVPKDSEWFGFYKEGQVKQVYTLEQSVLYINDTLGLQTLDKMGKLNEKNKWFNEIVQFFSKQLSFNEGRLFRLSVDGDHLRFSKQWFIENIVQIFLSK